MDHDIAALACSITNGSTGWLAHIIVAPHFRGQGLGYTLTNYAIETLENLGCTSQLLVATEMGEPLYL